MEDSFCSVVAGIRLVVAGAAGAVALKLLVALVHLMLSLGAKVLNTIASVKGRSNLFISLHEALEFQIEVFVLVLQNAAVVLKCIDLLAKVAVAALKALVRETEVVLFTAGDTQVLISGARFSLKLVKVAGESAVTSELSLGTVDKVTLLVHLKVKSAGKVALVVMEAGELFTGSVQIVLGGFESFGSAAEVKLAHVSDFSEFGSAFLQLE
jgi:hypothetical protein